MYNVSVGGLGRMKVSPAGERLKRQREGLRTITNFHEKIHAVDRYFKEMHKSFTCHDCTTKNTCSVDWEDPDDVKDMCTGFMLEGWKE